ncbi:MAG: SdpI family protein [Candidatus Nanohaloarchaea archaeon]
MELSRNGYASASLFAILAAVTVYGFVELSGRIAVHFSSAGSPDGYMAMVPGLLALPSLAVLTSIIFRYLPKIDPLGDNYESFEELFELLKLFLLAIFTYLQAALVAWNSGFRFNPSLMVVPVVFSAYFLAGKIMERAERNWFVGIRTPWTLSSDEVWRETHDRTAPLMKLAAFVSLLAVFLPRYSTYFYVVPVAAIALFASVYSYYLYRSR